MAAYYEDNLVTLWHGDFREVLPTLGVTADLIVADPPYGETNLAWDTWPPMWPLEVSPYAPAMWCFGSMRMFTHRGADFARWRMSQDVVWEKHNGSGFAADRFKRVHEHAVHWYRHDVPWSEVYHQVPTTPDATARQVRRKKRPPHTGNVGESSYRSEDGGPRLMRSVIFARSMHGKAINETEKPVELLEPLIRYGCRPGGLVIDPFAGSASTLAAARATGRRAIGVELREEQCERAALRLAASEQAAFDFRPGA